MPQEADGRGATGVAANEAPVCLPLHPAHCRRVHSVGRDSTGGKFFSWGRAVFDWIEGLKWLLMGSWILVLLFVLFSLIPDLRPAPLGVKLTYGGLILFVFALFVIGGSL